MYIILGFLLFFILISLLWRFSSNRLNLPCPSWLGYLLEIENPIAKITQSKNIIKHLNLKKGMLVLDIGCGPGRLTIPIAKKVGPKGNVTALDMQIEMLEKTKRKAGQNNLQNIDFLNINIENEKLDQNKYDRAILITVLGEIPKKQKALNEIFKSLKPGGILLITESIFDPHFQTKKSVLKFIKETNFQVKELIGNSFLAYTIILKKPLTD
jgi:ubiquinone/menaquinone biosynthesis C-methylase UbiE